jgi:hypothetical protein
MAMTALHIGYVTYGPHRREDPHLVQILSGLSGQTVCGLPVLGYGEMATGDLDELAARLAICPSCLKIALPD